MHKLRSIILCVVVAISACDEIATDADPTDHSQLPDMYEDYRPTDEETARAESLEEFDGTWVGNLVPIVDIKGRFRDAPDGVGIRIEIDGRFATVHFFIEDNSNTVIEGTDLVIKNKSAVLISSFSVDDGYNSLISISLHRSEPDVARMWFTITAGTPLRSGNDVWKHWAVFAEGELRVVP